MNAEMMEVLKLTTDQITKQRLPRWNELPDLEIYMDQVISLITRYIADFPSVDEKGLTASMVNNYVKLGMIPAPKKKKYTRTHLAYLIIICILKSVLPITLIHQMISDELDSGKTGEALYDSFCEQFERTDAAASSEILKLTEAESATELAFCAALRAQAEQSLAQTLLDNLKA